MSSNFTAFFIALIAFILSLSLMVQSASTADRMLGSRILMKKASKPEWDDLGFAWGKRSAPVEIVPVNSNDQQLSLQRYVRALNDAKKISWDDLGYAWGKK